MGSENQPSARCRIAVPLRTRSGIDAGCLLYFGITKTQQRHVRITCPSCSSEGGMNQCACAMRVPSMRNGLKNPPKSLGKEAWNARVEANENFLHDTQPHHPPEWTGCWSCRDTVHRRSGTPLPSLFPCYSLFLNLRYDPMAYSGVYRKKRISARSRGATTLPIHADHRSDSQISRLPHKPPWSYSSRRLRNVT
jgi:hypothetical protein